MEKRSRSKSIALVVLVAAACGFTAVAIYRVFAVVGEVRRQQNAPELDVDVHAAALRDRVERRWAAMATARLDDLYATLRDNQRRNDWPQTIRQIAAAGPDAHSASELMAFIDRHVVNGPVPNSIDFALDGNCNAFVALALTGGEAEHDFLLALMKEDLEHPKVADLLLIVEADMARLRASATLGLVLAGNEALQAEVRRLHAELKRRIDSGEEDPDDNYLYWNLERSAAAKKAVERFGEEILFVDNMSIVMGLRVVSQE